MKRIQVSVRDPQGTYIRTLEAARPTRFSKEINGGVGECIVEVDQQFDTFDHAYTLNNNLEILATADNADTFTQIFNGYISMIERVVERRREKIVLHCLGYHTLLSLDFLRDGTTTTLATDDTSGIGTSSATSADIGLVMRAIIDQYRTNTVNPRIYYTAQSVPLVGSDMAYTFEQTTYREAMDLVRQSAPADYFYYIDATGLVTFKKAESVTHEFILGKHFENVRSEQSLEKLRNGILVWGTGTDYEFYSDAASIERYGRRIDTLADARIEDSTTLDAIGEKFVAEHKDPDIRVVCEIHDGAYDIDSIEPGQMCRFLNFDSSIAEIFRDNMIITKVENRVSSATVTVERYRSGLLDIKQRMRGDIHRLDSNGIPASYS